MKSYFSHFANERTRPEILKLRIKHGTRGYGIYFMILEILRENENLFSLNDLNLLQYEIKEKLELIKEIILEYNLFTIENDCFYSEIIKENINKIKEIKEIKKRAAESRWTKKNENFETPQLKTTEIIKKNSSEVGSSEVEKIDLVDFIKNDFMPFFGLRFASGGHETSNIFQSLIKVDLKHFKNVLNTYKQIVKIRGDTYRKSYKNYLLSWEEEDYQSALEKIRKGTIPSTDPKLENLLPDQASYIDKNNERIYKYDINPETKKTRRNPNY